MSYAIRIAALVVTLLLPVHVHAEERAEDTHQQDTEGENTADNHMHPAFVILDASGRPVLETGNKPAPGSTCGACHDTQFIDRNNSHAEHIDERGCFVCHQIADVGQMTPADFDDEGRYRGGMSVPDSRVCGTCHGLATGSGEQVELTDGFVKAEIPGEYGSTLRVGEIFSPGLVSTSLMNIGEKEQVKWPWDVHAARGLECVSCHFAKNNPERSSIFRKNVQSHLIRDPRALSAGEYLKRPDHRMETAKCRDCHDPKDVHSTLPYANLHLAALACQSCHVSSLYAPALRAVDRTMVNLQGEPRLEGRGVIAREWRAPNTWFTRGFKPFLLEEKREGKFRFAPYNLIAEWNWVYGNAGQQVPSQDLKRALRNSDGSFVPDIVIGFDRDNNGTLSSNELQLNRAEEVEIVSKLLERAGFPNPRISGWNHCLSGPTRCNGRKTKLGGMS